MRYFFLAINEYQTFTSKLLGVKRSKKMVLTDYRFWPGFFIFIASQNSSAPVLLKFFLKIILRIFFSIETTSQCIVVSIPYLPHPRNIINGALWLGKEVVIYHNVTIGAKRIDIDFKSRPKISNGCIIATGAVVVGDGALQENTIIKANSLVIL